MPQVESLELFWITAPRHKEQTKPLCQPPELVCNHDYFHESWTQGKTFTSAVLLVPSIFWNSPVYSDYIACPAAALASAVQTCINLSHRITPDNLLFIYNSCWAPLQKLSVFPKREVFKIFTSLVISHSIGKKCTHSLWVTMLYTR